MKEKFIAAFLSVALTGWLVGCSQRNTAESVAASAQPPELRAIVPETGAVESSIPITGSLVSTVQVDVKTEAAGRLLVAPPREGEAVAKGQVLARLDDTQAKLSQQQAAAAAGVAEAGVDRARIAVEHADRELERARQVQASGGITVKDFQAAEWAARDARAQLRLAEAQHQQARETLALAEKRLRDAVVHAPIGGVVQMHVRNAGEYMDTNQPLVRLVDNSRLELEATLPSHEIGRVRPGLPVRFTVDAYPGEEFRGTVVQLAPGLIEESRSVKVRVAVPNPGLRLKAGMFVRGAIVAGVRRDALLLPISAVLRTGADPRKAAVLISENNVVRRREVVLGEETGGRIEITSGLNAGDRVLAEPQSAPAEGQPIRMKG